MKTILSCLVLVLAIGLSNPTYATDVDVGHDVVNVVECGDLPECVTVETYSFTCVPVETKNGLNVPLSFAEQSLEAFELHASIDFVNASWQRYKQVEKQYDQSDHFRSCESRTSNDHYRLPFVRILTC